MDISYGRIFNVCVYVYTQIHIKIVKLSYPINWIIPHTTMKIHTTRKGL